MNNRDKVLLTTMGLLMENDSPDYKKIFQDYCKDKIADLGTIDLPDAIWGDEEINTWDIVMTADEIRQFTDLRIINKEELNEDDNLIAIDKENNIVFNTPMITSLGYAARMEFRQIDREYYNKILEYWDDIYFDEMMEGYVEESKNLNEASAFEDFIERTFADEYNVNNLPKYEFRASKYAEINGIVDYDLNDNIMTYVEKYPNESMYEYTVNLDTMEVNLKQIGQGYMVKTDDNGNEYTVTDEIEDDIAVYKEAIKTYNETNYGWDNNSDTIYGELLDGNWFVFMPEYDSVNVYNCAIPKKYLDYLYRDEDEEKQQVWYDNFEKEHNITRQYDKDKLSNLEIEVNCRYYDMPAKVEESKQDKVEYYVVLTTMNKYNKGQQGYMGKDDVVSDYNKALKFNNRKEAQQAIKDFKSKYGYDIIKSNIESKRLDESKTELLDVSDVKETPIKLTKDTRNEVEIGDILADSSNRYVVSDILKLPSEDMSKYIYITAVSEGDWRTIYSTPISQWYGTYIIKGPFIKQDGILVKESKTENSNNITENEHNGYDIEYVTPNYTGGGVYEYIGKLADGNYFMAFDDYFSAENTMFDIRIVDTNPEDAIEDYGYADWQDLHIVRDLNEVEAKEFTIKVLNWIINNIPDGNYDINDMKGMLEVIYN